MVSPSHLEIRVTLPDRKRWVSQTGVSVPDWKRRVSLLDWKSRVSLTDRKRGVSVPDWMSGVSLPDWN
jgi:hypothetical protein